MKLKAGFVISLLLASVQLFAADRQLPLLFNYQGALIDDGGNPLPDGATGLKFQVLNSAGTVLYEELQDLEVAKGQVSAIVGNGLAPSSGAPTGGISADIFDPTDTLYLQVTAAGQKPYDLMQIVTVPYALWADTALSLPDGAITSAMIGKGVVTKEHLDAELFAAIFPNGIPKAMLPSDTVYTDDFQGFKNTIQSTYGASKVGVTTAFIYSGSQTVQGVLSDLDLAIKKRQEEVEFAKKDYGIKVGAEEAARKDADTAEANTRTVADGVLQTNINNEAATRVASDGSLQGQITSHSNATSVHGVAGDVVGTASNQSLVNKVLVAPVIVGGVNANPAIGVDLSTAANEGVVVDGDLKVTGNLDLAGVIQGTSYARIASGSYTGNGVNPHAITGVGFKPNVVFIARYGDFFGVSTTNIYFRYSETGEESVGSHGSSTSSQDLPPAVITIYAIDQLHMDADGFTLLNAEPNWNQGGFTYWYTAIGAN